MAENLCGNPKTQISIEGRTFESPCGWTGCSYKDFQDWLSTFKRNLNILKSTYKKLEHYQGLQDNPSFTKEEQEIEKKIQSYSLFVDELKLVKDGDSSSTYKQLIEELKVNISQSACDIEVLQNGIEDRGGRIIPSGLTDSRSSVFASPWFKWAAVGMVGYAAFRWIDYSATK